MTDYGDHRTDRKARQQWQEQQWGEMAGQVEVLPDALLTTTWRHYSESLRIRASIQMQCHHEFVASFIADVEEELAAVNDVRDIWGQS